MKESNKVKLGSVKRNTLSRQVLEQIAELLISGELKPGDKLPTEAELMEMLAVSRPILREALISLETLGVIKRKTREGTYFSEKIGSDPFRIMLALSIGDLNSILEARLTQELGLVTLAAEKITTEQLARLEETIQAMEASDGDYMDVDREFHRIIAYSGSNSITEGLINPVLNMFDQSFQHIASEKRDKNLTIEQHTAIYMALKNRDPIEAHLAMYRHLDRVRRSVLASIASDA